MGDVQGAGRQFASATLSGAVTPSDSTDINFNALFIGTAGNIAIKHSVSGATVTYTGVLAGSILPVCGVRVMAATTASNIVWMRW